MVLSVILSENVVLQCVSLWGAFALDLRLLSSLADEQSYHMISTADLTPKIFPEHISERSTHESHYKHCISGVSVDKIKDSPP